jgi:ADP-ribose pyrophosphatase YjhB (NUDIX family)
MYAWASAVLILNALWLTTSNFWTPAASKQSGANGLRGTLERLLQEFQNIAELERWLSAQAVDTARWGSDGAKTVENLWQEYRRGEVAFQDEPAARMVNVVQILLRRGDLLLIEIAQELDEGRMRQRGLPPSEKFIAGESPLAAARRGLMEELALDPARVESIELAGDAFKRAVESPSYPGLLTIYTVHTVEVLGADLPAADFWLDNKAALHGDPVQRHLWGWRRRS